MPWLIDLLARELWRSRWTAVLVLAVLVPASWWWVLQRPDSQSAHAQIFLFLDTPGQFSVAANAGADIVIADKGLISLSAFLNAVGLPVDPSFKSELAGGHYSALTIRRSDFGGRGSTYEFTVNQSSHGDAVELLRIVVQRLRNVVEIYLSTIDARSDDIDELISNQSMDIQQLETQLSQLVVDSADIDVVRLESIDERISQEQAAVARLTEELERIRNDQAQLASVHETAATDIDEFPTDTKYDREILRIEGEIAELLVKFTTRHPDVVERQDTLESLRRDRRRELDTLRAVVYVDQEEGRTGYSVARPDMSAEINDLVARIQRHRNVIDELERSKSNASDAQILYVTILHRLREGRENLERLLVERSELRSLGLEGKSVSDVITVVNGIQASKLTRHQTELIYWLAGMTFVAILAAYLSSALRPVIRHVLCFRPNERELVIGHIAYFNGIRDGTDPRPSRMYFAAGLALVFLVLLYFVFNKELMIAVVAESTESIVMAVREVQRLVKI